MPDPSNYDVDLDLPEKPLSFEDLAAIQRRHLNFIHSNVQRQASWIATLVVWCALQSIVILFLFYSHTF